MNLFFEIPFQSLYLHHYNRLSTWMLDLRFTFGRSDKTYYIFTLCFLSINIELSRYIQIIISIFYGNHTCQPSACNIFSQPGIFQSIGGNNIVVQHVRRVSCRLLAAPLTLSSKNCYALLRLAEPPYQRAVGLRYISDMTKYQRIQIVIQ